MTIQDITDTFYILIGSVLAYWVFISFMKGHLWAYSHADCLPMIPLDTPDNEFLNEFSIVASMMGKAKTRQQMNRYFDRIYDLQEKYILLVDELTLRSGINNLLDIYQKKVEELGLE